MKKILIKILFIFSISISSSVLAKDNIRADEFIQQLADQALNIIKTDQEIRQGDIKKINKIVDEFFMPHVDFRRITAASVGPKWRSATPKQREQLVAEFRGFLINTYAGALKQATNQKIKVLPLRKNELNLDNLTVKSKVKVAGNNEINVDYRLRKEADRWLVYDVNVAGIWFVETYRQQFAPIVNDKGIDALIKELQKK